MGDPAARASELMKKADKKIYSFGFFGGSKYDDAAEMYERAANQFKLAKAWADAGLAFEKLAQTHLKLDSGLEAASSYVEAAKCYQKTNKADVLRVLHNAVAYYTDAGRLGMAAKQLREVAETMEKQNLKEESIEFYNQVAQFSAEMERYEPAIQIYEDVAHRSMDNNLLKFSAKGYLLNAGICRLCVGDAMELTKALDRYEDIDYTFSGSREGKLLRDLAEAQEQGDMEKFTDAVAEFDSMTRLDQWKTTLLLRAKKRIEGGPSAFGADEPDLT